MTTGGAIEVPGAEVGNYCARVQIYKWKIISFIFNYGSQTVAKLFQFYVQIAKCFHEGQYTLPGPPRNIRVTPMNAHSAVATWEPPVKNPEYVELYRILWRKEGAR